MNRFHSTKEALVLVAHADDETIGCGGYMPILAARGWRVTVVIASCGRFRRGESEVDNRAAALEAGKVLNAESVHFLDLEDQRFEQYGTRDLTERLHRLDLNPHLILTHSAGDLNRDHRVIHEIALLYGRPLSRRANILACEIPNNVEYGGGAFRANFFVDITTTLHLKQRAFACYGPEIRPFPHPHSLEGLEIKAKQRGMEAGLPFAEAYQVVRWFDPEGGGHAR